MFAFVYDAIAGDVQELESNSGCRPTGHRPHRADPANDKSGLTLSKSGLRWTTSGDYLMEVAHTTFTCVARVTIAYRTTNFAT